MYADDIQVPIFSFVCCVFHWEEGKICMEGSNFASLMLSSDTLCTVIIVISMIFATLSNNNREDVCALMAIFVLIKSHQKKGRNEHVVSEHRDEFTWALFPHIGSELDDLDQKSWVSRLEICLMSNDNASFRISYFSQCCEVYLCDSRRLITIPGIVSEWEQFDDIADVDNRMR